MLSKTLRTDEAPKLSGENPDYTTEDLFSAIKNLTDIYVSKVF